MVPSIISHYKILEKLGEGGMGIVYKAQDTKLDRIVALKFLPHHLTQNDAEKARFLQEAKAASALNHPNACTIFDINEENDQQFIVMEYIDGKTLRQMVPIQKMQIAIDYAVQIGGALQEAHNKGIVHRDIKTDNIMVNSKNQIKVLDFGLARLRGSLKLTKTRSTVGTLAYMAPEQIQGGEVDARSDIFSFGVVLFEMLAGHMPFRGDHEAAMMYSILNDEPESVQNIRQDIPGEMDRIIHRAVEKDPEDRYQHIDDMVSELRRLLKQSSRVSRKPLEGIQSSASYPSPEQGVQQQTSSVVTPSAPQVDPVLRNKGIPLWGKMAGGFLALVLIALGLWQFLKPGYEISKDMVFRPLNIPFSTIWYPAISSDGNWIAFPATDEQGVTEIYYMNASGGEPKRLTHDSLFKYQASISPDGSQIAYSRGVSRKVGYLPHMSLWTVPTLGAEPKKVADPGMYGIFSPDGKSMGYSTWSETRTEFLIMDADGSNKRPAGVESTNNPGFRESFAWSPDGGSLVFIRNIAATGGFVQEVVTREIQSGKEKELTHDGKNIDEIWWTANGLILFSSNRGGATNLWAIPAAGGTPVQITKGPGPDIAVRASRDGRRVLYLQQAEFGSIQIGNADGSNSREITPADQSVQNPRFSPDGRTIAYIVTDSDPIKPGSSIYLMSRDGQNRRRVVQMSSSISLPLWSPDGRKIAYSFQDSVWHVGVVNVEISGQPLEVGKGVVQQWLGGSSALNILRGNACWSVPLDGTAPSKISEDSTAILFSPEGNSQLLIERKNGALRVFLKNAAGAHNILHEENGGSIRWSPDGKNLILVKTDGTGWLLSPDGKARPYVWKDPATLFLEDITQDLKASVSVRHRQQSKLILIDNFM